jgi:Fe-coproporphyrin III synthase
MLNIHTQCNCRCVMCDIWQRKDSSELRADSLERHRDSLISLGVELVVLTGGEALLNRDLPAIIEFFRSLGIRITLLSTGLLLRSKAALIAKGIDEVILSIDGPAEVHNAIRRIPRAFETIAGGIETLRTLNPGIPINCRTTVQKQNHAHLRATVDAAHSLGLNSISFLPADVTSSSFNREVQPWPTERQDEIALTASEVLTLEEEIELLIESHQPDFRARFIAENETKLRRISTRFREHLEGTVPQSPRCNAPWVSTVMEVDGTLRPCFFHPPVASTANATLEEALNSQLAQAFRSQLDVASNPICQRCVCSLNYR